jgi:hypothetical protein
MTGRYAVAPAGALLLPPSAWVSLRLIHFFRGLRPPGRQGQGERKTLPCSPPDQVSGVRPAPVALSGL